MNTTKKILLLVLVNSLWTINYLPNIGLYIGLFALVLFPISYLITIFLALLLFKKRGEFIVFVTLVLFFHLVRLLPIFTHYSNFYFNIDLADKGYYPSSFETLISTIMIYFIINIPCNSYLLKKLLHTKFV